MDTVRVRCIGPGHPDKDVWIWRRADDPGHRRCERCRKLVDKMHVSPLIDVPVKMPTPYRE